VGPLTLLLPVAVVRGKVAGRGPGETQDHTIGFLMAEAPHLQVTLLKPRHRNGPGATKQTGPSWVVQRAHAMLPHAIRLDASVARRCTVRVSGEEGVHNRPSV
jgi:hypothetical protein